MITLRCAILGGHLKPLNRPFSAQKFRPEKGSHRDLDFHFIYRFMDWADLRGFSDFRVSPQRSS
jgi:hypothetical protein